MFYRLMALFTLLTLALPVAAQDTAATHIARVVEAMEAAVLSGDQAAYLRHVDLSDPVFALEHERWTQDWADGDLLADFTLDVDEITVDGGEASGEMTLRWTLADDPDSTREAVYPARFTLNRGVWRYAGEAWVTTEETEHFTLRVAPGLETVAGRIAPRLPEIYAYVTGELDHEPRQTPEIKVYASSEALVANTLLSLPPISGWNEPGEAIKLWSDGAFIPQSTVAHELTHLLSFDMAGGYGNAPWWLEEGMAQLMGSHFWPAPQVDEYLAIAQNLLAEGALADWESMRYFAATPQRLWQYVYPQGYAFARFVSETYGAERRNAWFRAMATQSFEEATAAELGTDFAALDAEFRVWLAQV